MGRYRKYYYTQSSPVSSPYSIGNTLTGTVYSHLNTKGSDLSLLLRDAAENSMAGLMWKIAKNCQPGKKYANTIGTPEGTLITEPLNKGALATEIPDIQEIVSQSLTPLSPDVLLALAYDKLVKDYAYDGTHVIVDDTEYLFESVSVDDNKELTLNYYELISHGPYSERIEHDVSLGQSIPNIESEYLVVKYLNSDGDTKYYVYVTAQKSLPAVDSWLQNQRVLYYPSFFARKDKRSIKESDPEHYEASREALKRCNIDWEDLVDSYNGETELNEESDSDREYRNSLGDVTDICLTFALDITVNDQRVMRYMYEFFKFLYKAGSLNSNRINYRHKAFNYDFSWGSIQYAVKQGVIAKFHRFTTECTDIEDPVTVNGHLTMNKHRALRIRRQLTSDSFEEFLVSDVKFTSYNNGEAMVRKLKPFANLKPYTKADLDALEADKDDDDEEEKNECLIPILPIIIRRSLGGIIGGDILHIGMRTIHNTYKKVKKKWYQSGWFSVVRIVISIVIIVCTLGSGTPYVIAANVALNIALNILIQILICLAIKLAVKMICKVLKIKGLLLNVINTITNIVMMVYLPGSAGFNMLASSMADCALSGSFSLQNLANALTQAASVPLMMANPALGVLFETMLNPEFYYAIQTGNWSQAIIQVAGSVLKAATVSMQLGANTEGGSSLLDPVTKQFDYTKLTFDTATSSTAQLSSQLGSYGLNLVSSAPSYIMAHKSEKLQEQMNQMNKKMLRLSNNMSMYAEISESILAKNIQAQAFIVDQIFNYDEDLDFYRFDKGFTGTFILNV